MEQSISQEELDNKIIYLMSIAHIATQEQLFKIADSLKESSEKELGEKAKDVLFNLSLYVCSVCDSRFKTGGKSGG